MLLLLTGSLAQPLRKLIEQIPILRTGMIDKDADDGVGSVELPPKSDRLCFQGCEAIFGWRPHLILSAVGLDSPTVRRPVDRGNAVAGGAAPPGAAA